MAGDLRLQLRITGDAKGLQAAVVDAVSAVGQIGPAAQTGAQEATVALDKVVQAEREAATAATTTHTAVEQIGPAAQTGGAQAVTALDKVVGGAREATVAVKQATAAIQQIGPASASFSLGLTPLQAMSGATRQVTASTSELSEALDRLVQSVDPVAASAARLSAAEQLVARAQAAGVPVTTAQQQALATLRKRHDETVAASGALGRQTGITRLQMQQLVPQINDVVTSLALGIPVQQVALQQGTQITQVFGGVGNTFRAVVGAIGPARIAAAALAVGLGLVLAHGSSLQGQQRQLEVALRGTGRAAEVSATQLQGYVRQLQNAGDSNASSTVAGLARTQGLSATDIGRAVGLAPSLAAVQGTDVASAAQQLGEAFSSGYSGIKKLDDALNFLTADERRQVQTMLEHGQRAEALRLASGRLSAQLAGADKDAASAIANAFKEITSAWNGFADAIGRSSFVQAGLNAIAVSVKTIADGIKLITPGTELEVLQHRQRDLLQQLAGTDSYGAPAVTGSARQALEAELSSVRGQIGGMRMLQGGEVTGGAATAPEVAAPKSAGETERQRKTVDELTQSYRDQQRVLSVGITQRGQMQARIDAEREASEKQLTGLDREELIRRRVAEVTEREAAARGDELTAMTAETAAAVTAVAASEQGRAAMMRASAAAEAHAQSLSQPETAEKALAQAILNRNAAQIATQGADQALQLREQAEGAERVAAAMRGGWQAGHVAEVEEQVRQLTAQIRAAAEATDDPRLKRLLNGLAGSIGQSVQRNDLAQQSQRVQEMLLGQRQDAETLRLQLTGGLGGPGASQLADLQAVHELERARVDVNSELSQQYRQQARDIASLSVQVRQHEESWQEATGALKDGFSGVGQQIASDLQNSELGFRTLEKVGISVASSLISKFAELAISNPLLNLVGVGGGNLATLSGLFGGGGASSAGTASLSGFTFAPLLHGGGPVAGGGIGSRLVPTELFANARRLHTGGPAIGPGEVATILRDDEWVFTPEQLGRAGRSINAPTTILFSGDAGSPADRRRLRAMVDQAVDQRIARHLPGITAASTASTISSVKRGGDAARAFGRV